MRISNLYLGKYSKSFNNTQKVIRTISKQKCYTPKRKTQEVEIDYELQACLDEQKQTEKEIQKQMDNALNNIKADGIQYYALIFYGIKLNRGTILEKLKARKAK